jgi:hypothetical protein
MYFVYVFKCICKICTHCGSTLFLMMARARHWSWRYPTLKLVLPSDTLWLSPAGSSSTTCLNSTSARAAHSAASVHWSNGSRLVRRVPVNSTGSCGMMEILDRRSWSPIRMVFTPSMCIRPHNGSTKRNKAVMREDLQLQCDPHCLPASETQAVNMTAAKGNKTSGTCTQLQGKNLSVISK